MKDSRREKLFSVAGGIDALRLWKHRYRLQGGCGGQREIQGAKNLTYDFCSLHAPEPENGATYIGPASNQAMLLDMAVSGVLDTLLLPYTIYRQHSDGSLIIVQ